MNRFWTGNRAKRALIIVPSLALVLGAATLILRVGKAGTPPDRVDRTASEASAPGVNPGVIASPGSPSTPKPGSSRSGIATLMADYAQAQEDSAAGLLEFEENVDMDRIYVSIGRHPAECADLLRTILASATHSSRFKGRILSAIRTHPAPELLTLLVGMLERNELPSTVLGDGVAATADLAARLARAPKYRSEVARARKVHESLLHSGREEERATAIKTYFKFHTHSDYERKAVRLFRSFFLDPSERVRTALTRVLDARYSEGYEALAVEAESEFLRATDEASRSAAFRILSSTRTERAKRHIIDALSAKPRRLRSLAVTYAGGLQLEEAVPLLAEIAVSRKEADAQLRHHALDALANIGTARAVVTVIDHLSRESERERQLTLIEPLSGSQKFPKSFEVGSILVDAYRSQSDSEIRQLLVNLMVKNGSQVCLDWMAGEYGQSTNSDLSDSLGAALLSSPGGPEFCVREFESLVRSSNSLGAIDLLSSKVPDKFVGEVKKAYGSKNFEDIELESRLAIVRVLGDRISQFGDAELRRIREVDQANQVQDLIEGYLSRQSDP